MPLGAVARGALIASRYVYALLRDLAAGEISLRAMGLVYTTMLAVVPLLAFSFSVAKGLGVHRQLEPLLLQFLDPIGPRAAEISGSVVGFVDNTSGTFLAALSIGLLLLTALSMAQKIEASFNFVWRVDRPRSLARRASDYLSFIFIGPIIMIVATASTAALASASVVQRLSAIEPLGSWLSHLSAVTPYVLIVVTFAFLYLLIPNTRVRLQPALIGGLFGGTAWVSAGKIFTATIVSSTQYEAIYSGFAIVIIIMIWLHLSWLILLLGSQLAYYVQHPYQLPLGQRTGPVDSRLRERLALSVMLLIGRDFESPNHGWRSESLAAELRVPRSAVESLVMDLTAAGLIAETTELRLVPGRATGKIALVDILAAVRGTPPVAGLGEDKDWEAAVTRVAENVDAAIDAALAGRSLADLVANQTTPEPIPS
jgi:membrane protein